MTMNGPRSGSRELPDEFRLGVGSHKAPGKRMCTMEAVAWIAGLPHSAAPDSASPIIAIFVQALNDRMDEERRQHLRRYVSRLIDTCDPRLEPDQARLLASRAIDHFLPAALHDAGHSFFARQLEVADRWPDRQAWCWHTLHHLSDLAAKETAHVPFWLQASVLSEQTAALLEMCRSAGLLIKELNDSRDWNSCSSLAAVIIASAAQASPRLWSETLQILEELLWIRVDTASRQWEKQPIVDSLS